MSDPTAIKYRAFLSYSHVNTREATRLHAQLEKFRLDKDLVDRETDTMGPVPKSLRPIFRDREEFTGGHSLTEATIAALDASQALVVLCSPAAAASYHVNEEVRLFRHRHPGRPVIPVLIDGTAPDNFPPALRYDLDADGSISEKPVTILGTDLRETGDGPQLGLAKIVAGLTGLASDDVYRRAERARRKSARFRNAVIAVLALLTIAATGSAVFAWQQLKTNEKFLIATLKRASGIIDTAVRRSNEFGIPRTVTLELLQQAEGLFDDMAELGRETPELKRQKAWMLIQFARNYAILGQTDKQKQYVAEAEGIMRSIAKIDTNDLTAQRDLSVAFNERGNVLVAQGNLPQALDSFQASLAIAERLAKAAPGNAGWQRDLSVSYEKIGSVLVAQGNLPQALDSFQASLAIRERLAEADPRNAGWQADLAASYGKLGQLHIALGKKQEALRLFQAGKAIVEPLALQSQHTLWRRYLQSFNAYIASLQAEP
ncbi:MAG: toll/interleukin-1 receptor domain-containing protein [Pseudomonadota bacterium]